MPNFCYCFVQCESKNKTLYSCWLLHEILIDFQNSFTGRFSTKFPTKWSSHIPPHLRDIAALPCETVMFQLLTSSGAKILLKRSASRRVKVGCHTAGVCWRWSQDWHLLTITTSCCINSCCLSYIGQISGEFFIFQQDSAPAHTARDTISLLERDTPAFISPALWPLNSSDLNLVVYKDHYAAQSLPDKGQGSGRFEVPSDWCVGWCTAEPYWQYHQWVA